MQNNEQRKSDLDADILQCKLDLQRALQAGNRVPLIPDKKPIQIPQSTQPLNPEQSSESNAPISGSSRSPSSPVGIHIMPFETLQKKTASAEQATASIPSEPEPDVSPDPEAPPPPPESIEPLHEKIHLLEQQLAEKIGQISALKLQIEEQATALSEQAETVRRTGEEKETAEKRLETQAAEWALTLESLKEAQAQAMQTRDERQQQLEALRKELSDAQLRLEQSDSTNAALTRENTELLDILNNVRLEKEREREDAVSEFEMTDEDTDAFDDPSLEPYCEPTGEIISEDDVHLEQKLADNAVPTFNLAEQILTEQRKTSSERRQGPARNGGKTTSNSSIEHVMQQYVTDKTAPPPQDQPLRPAGHSQRFLRWHGEGLTAYQTELLDTIIHNDIRRLCGANVSFSPYHSTMDN